MSADNSSRDELQQQLLELVYGLLDAAEAAALEERIKTDPEVAVAHAEAQRFADVLAASARLAAPHIEFTPPKRAPWRQRIEIKADRNGEAEMTSSSNGAALPLTPCPSPARGEGKMEGERQRKSRRTRVARRSAR